MDMFKTRKNNNKRQLKILRDILEGNVENCKLFEKVNIQDKNQLQKTLDTLKKYKETLIDQYQNYMNGMEKLKEMMPSFFSIVLRELELNEEYFSKILDNLNGQEIDSNDLVKIKNELSDLDTKWAEMAPIQTTFYTKHRENELLFFENLKKITNALIEFEE